MGVGYLSKDIKDNKKKIIIRAIILLLIIGIVLVVFFANKDISGYFNDSSQIEGTIGDNGIWGMLIYIGLQAIQVIIAVIPGEPIQLAGGYIFGVWGGFILSAIGIMLGSSIGFFIAKRFGYPVVRLFVNDEEKLESYKRIIESRKGSAIIFTLAFIPGIPKDILVYAVGLTPIKYIRFFFIYFVARIPSLFLASYMGKNAPDFFRFLSNNKWLALLLLFAFIVLTYLFYRWRKKKKNGEDENIYFDV